MSDPATEVNATEFPRLIPAPEVGFIVSFRGVGLFRRRGSISSSMASTELDKFLIVIPYSRLSASISSSSSSSSL
jgi:hypothetical protein